MERLYVLALMGGMGLECSEEFNAVLDELFMSNPSDSLLLDLEVSSQDSHSVWELVESSALFGPDALDLKLVERFFLKELEKVYHSNRCDIRDFASCAYAAWERLPESVMESEGLREMHYADDYLVFWGDEESTRECYEEMFVRAHITEADGSSRMGGLAVPVYSLYDKVRHIPSGKICFIIDVDEGDDGAVFGLEAEDQADTDWFYWAEEDEIEPVEEG